MSILENISIFLGLCLMGVIGVLFIDWVQAGAEERRNGRNKYDVD